MIEYKSGKQRNIVSEFEFETVANEGDSVILEKSSQKNRSTPAKFLDSYIRINDDILILEKNINHKMLLRKDTY